MICGRLFPRHQASCLLATSRRNYRHDIGKDKLINEYHMAKEWLENKKLPDDVEKCGIFANEETNLNNIDVYGYDYDYTLAAYKQSTVEQMIHSLAKKTLVQDFRYPEVMLDFEYDPDLTIRGLHYDVTKGLLLKVDSFLQIQTDAVFRGRRKLSVDEVLRTYKGKQLTNEEVEIQSTSSGMVQLVDNFAKPVMNLLLDVIHWFVESGIDYEPESIYQDVKECIDRAHPLFHLAAASDPTIILEKDPKLKPMLERLRQSGKQVFVVTNSPFEIVNAGMQFMLGEDWRELFDVVIVSAKKPSFFSAQNRHFRVLSPKSNRLKWKKVNALERGSIYSGGNYEMLEKMTDWQSDRVLYFGDHPYADLAHLSMFHGWRTCAIIQEIETEIEKGNLPSAKKRVNWSTMLQSLIERNQDYAVDAECKLILDDWKDELRRVRVDMKENYNHNFGSVFRSNRNPTYFSRRLFRMADIYTSSVTNFSNYSLNHTFYPRRGVLPHEFRSWFV